MSTIRKAPESGKKLGLRGLTSKGRSVKVVIAYVTVRNHIIILSVNIAETPYGCLKQFMKALHV